MQVSGIELVSMLVGSEKFQHVPVVIMSTDFHEDIVFEALEAGATDFLVKPIRKEKLETLWKHASSTPASSRGID